MMRHAFSTIWPSDIKPIWHFLPGGKDARIAPALRGNRAYVALVRF